jgi:hypothetical protein
MRNSNVLAVAPTATISNIMGTSPCIEPLYRNLFVKSNLSGEFVVLNPYRSATRRRGDSGARPCPPPKRHDGDLTAPKRFRPRSPGATGRLSRSIRPC